MSLELNSNQINTEFDKNAKLVKNLSQSPDNEEKLLIYSLYKQSLNGDNNKSKPWAYQLTEVAKWNAWAKLKGQGIEESKRAYIKTVQSMIIKYGLKK